MGAPSGSAPTNLPASAAPWVLPKVCPPAMSATVSSSFIAARERFADVQRRGERVGLAVRPFRIHVDQTHLNGGERVLEIAVPGVALVRQPLAFGAPVDVLRGLPYIHAPGAKAEGLEAHRLQRAVACEDNQVGPRDLLAVLLFD